MRRDIILLLFLAVTLPLAGQLTADCEPVIFQQLDSVVNYTRQGQTDIYMPVDVFLYQHSDFETESSVTRLSLPSRIPVNRQLYFYNDNGLKSLYVLEAWDGSRYVNSSKTDYYYDDEGYKVREVFSSYQEGSWRPYQQHWYNYDEEGTVLTYLRQMMYSPDVWTDYSYKNYIYDDQGRLTERNEQRLSDDVIFWVELFTYNDQGKTDTRVRQTLKYYPETRAYGLVNLSRQIYSYDRYGEMCGYLSETWTNNEWVLTGKSIYYRSLLYDRRIPVCYHGITIMVPVRVAVRLFARGALPGSCECLFPEGVPEGPKCCKGKPAGDGLTVYPNPASSMITLVLPEGLEVNGEISIYNHQGSLVKRTVAGSPAETVDISDLSAGSYYLIFTVDGRSLMTSFVKKN